MTETLLMLYTMFVAAGTFALLPLPGAAERAIALRGE